MPYRRMTLLLIVASGGLLAAVLSCAPEYRPWWLGGTPRKGGVFSSVNGTTFTEVLIDQRRFVDGKAITTWTHYVDDMTRRRVLVDFNEDGKADPVVAYGDKMGVVQILLSQGPIGTAEFLSLTLDGGENSWYALLDVAVGDIDGDARLDIVAATRDGIVYLRHPPAPYATSEMRLWGAEEGLLELIEGTTDTLSGDEQLAIITQAVGPGANLDNYNITVEQGYTNVEIGDVDNDGHADIVGSRRLRINMEPASGKNVEPLLIVAGSLQCMLNPGRATTGEAWTTATLSQHERHSTAFDREGAHGLWLEDLDGDGDLDVISAATDDINVQVAWFENPGGTGPFDPTQPWTQYRIGSIRGADQLDVADVTGDGRVDVIATAPDMQRLMLFVQPSDTPKRSYDWDTAAIVQFENYDPSDVKALDVDADGVLELVIGGTEGAVRYFESPLDATTEWPGEVITTLDPPGIVRPLGYGDLDGDNDLDLILALDSEQDQLNDRVVWIRNELYP